MSERYKVKEIIRTKWQYNLNANSLYKTIYNDGYTQWDYYCPYVTRFNISNKEALNILNYLRDLKVRKDSEWLNDRYELSIYKYDELGNRIKSFVEGK